MKTIPNHKQKSALAIAISAGIAGMTVADEASATTYTATLTSILTYSNNGTAALNFSSSTGLSWSYDDATNLMTQTGGTLDARATTAPTSTLFRHQITGLVIGNGGAGSATTFTCVEGNFGGGVGSSICGNYNLGANYVNETTTTWGPGTAVTRTLGGDDFSIGAVQSVSGQYSGFSLVSWVGTTLILENKQCVGACLTNPPGSGSSGYTYTFDAPQTVDAFPVIEDGNITTFEDNASAAFDPSITLGDGTDVQHTLVVTTQATNGDCVVNPENATGTVVYTPDAGYTGADSCVLTLTDTDSDTDTATLSITVNPRGANDDLAVTTRGQTVVIAPGSNDEGFDDTVAVSLANGGVCTEGGTAEVTAGQGQAVGDIRITYTPFTIAAGTSGNPVDTDVCTYTLDDGVAPADSADISIAVSNSVPVANDGTITISSAGVAPVGLTGTFTSPGTGGSLGNAGVTTVDAGTNGTTSVAGNVITYTVATAFVGNDTFTYTVTDADGAASDETDTGTVTVTIADVNPEITGGSTQTTAGTASAAFDLDVDLGNGSADQHTLAVFTAATNGTCVATLASNGTGTVVYTPTDGYTGSDTCSVRLTDLDGNNPDAAASNATITVTVNAADSITLPGGSSSMDLWSLSLLGSLPLLMRRRRRS
jgi:hypothetical protein